MPYVKDYVRVALDDKINQLVDRFNERVDEDDIDGALNYALTEILLGTYQGRGRLRYRILNRIMGVLTCMQMEIYRRLSWYEDVCEDQNGDINAFDRWSRWK